MKKWGPSIAVMLLMRNVRPSGDGGGSGRGYVSPGVYEYLAYVLFPLLNQNRLSKFSKEHVIRILAVGHKVPSARLIGSETSVDCGGPAK